MVIYNSAEAAILLERGTNSPHAVLEKDEAGQFVLRTGLFVWSDGTVRDVAEFIAGDEDEPLHPFDG